MRRLFSLNRRRWISLVTFAVSGMASSVALAQVGSTVNVVGQLTAGTCQWDVGGPNRSVRLAPINVSRLKQGQVAGLTTFDLSLINCAAGLASATFSFSGTSDATDRLRFQNTGTATGVAVELQSSDGRTIGADGTDSTRVATIASNRATLQLQAGYWQVAPRASSGTVAASATFTIRYN